ncbi:THAP domain-containing protein 1-like [Ornithodoros turicata]|uniref:THAP domain-containing protein 1-like n=1 Tax=Ornithodoros turicata TaxID=34597 RepID=UPI0031388B75
MPSCSAWGCRNKQGGTVGASFHRFPFGRADILKLWLHNMSRENWEPNRKSLLCSDHFLERCFDRTGQTVRLRWAAIPTMFAYPEDKKPEVIEYIGDKAHAAESNLTNLDVFEVEEDDDDLPVVTTAADDAVLDKAAAAHGIEHNYHEDPTKQVPADVADKVRLRKKLKTAHQRIRRLDERVSTLNDMVYSLLHNKITEL